MKLDLEIVYDDVIDYQKVAIKKFNGGVTFTTYIATMLILWLLFHRREDFMLFDMVLRLVFAVIIWLPIRALALFILGFFQKIMPAKENLRTGKRQYVITKEGFRETTELHDLFYRWSGSMTLIQTKKVIILFISKENGFIIPKRCFPSEQQAQEFFSMINAYLKGFIWNSPSNSLIYADGQEESPMGKETTF